MKSSADEIEASLLAGDPRVLITRLSAIGDCIQSLPVACALKDRYPRAQVTWVVEQAAAPLVAACRAVDRVLVVPKKYLASPSLGWELHRQLAPLGIQIALDPQGLSKSSAIGWLSQAPRRIGLAAPAGREISPWLNNELVVPKRLHMVERYLELLGPLGIDNPPVDFGLEIDQPGREWVASWFADIGLTGSFAVINPGAGWDSKRWPAERLAAVACYLDQRWNLPTVVVWAGPRERAWAEEIVTCSPHDTLLAPATSLTQLMELLRQARLMIAADTGPLHLSAAVGTPCVGFFGPTSRDACGPYGEGGIALQRAQDRAANRKRPGASNWAVREISVEMACQACDELLHSSFTLEKGFLPVDWALTGHASPPTLIQPARAA